MFRDWRRKGALPVSQLPVRLSVLPFIGVNLLEKRKQEVLSAPAEDATFSFPGLFNTEKYSPPSCLASDFL